jgi:hypothetical protein
VNSNDAEAKPTVADEVSSVVDDAEVISKTLPAHMSHSPRLMSRANHAVEVTRGYVIEQPVQAVLIAAAGGAALTALVVAVTKSRSQLR